MDPYEFGAQVLLNLPFEANSQQEAVVGALARFCWMPMNDSSQAVFILNGYAGTGKTSIMGALVRTLKSCGVNTMLLAPTGRAAKVFSSAAGMPAYTIHRKIYRHSLPGQGGGMNGATVRENKNRNTVFVVDEASMIGGDPQGSAGLLEDLLQYVYTGDNCRLILLGDTAQLPPVGSAISPAMNPDSFRRLGLRVNRATLTATERQGAMSGILHNATTLRRVLHRLSGRPSDSTDPVPVPRLRTDAFADIDIVSGEDLPDLISKAYSPSGGGIADTIIITRSNRKATEFNQAVRAQVLYREEELERDDMLIVAKNHYFNSGDKIRGLEFIANGDILSVVKVYGTEAKYGFRFADVRLSTQDPAIEFDAKILLDTLHSDAPALTRDRMTDLYYAIMTDPEIPANYGSDMERTLALLRNPYWNALQVKYAYAVTCHKAQGGQWRNVFIDLSYIPEEALGAELYRWLYTAVTRARTNLYLISPPSALTDAAGKD